MQFNYNVIFVADGTAAFSDAEHNGTLNSLGALFADVMRTADVVALLEDSAAAPAASAALAT
jgi:ureidoacrylate peracid hydrolase